MKNSIFLLLLLTSLEPLVPLGSILLVEVHHVQHRVQILPTAGWTVLLSDRAKDVGRGEARITGSILMQADMKMGF